MSISILAIDCGMHLGLCYEPVIGHPEVDTFPLGGSQGTKETGLSYGRAASRAAQKLRELIGLVRPSVVIFESPIPVDRKDDRGNRVRTPDSTVRVLFGLPWMIEGICYEHGITCAEGHIQTVRRHVAGNGSTPKDKMPLFVRSLLGQPGLQFPSLDACDAAALWLYAKSIYSPGYFPPGALLGRASR